MDITEQVTKWVENKIEKVINKELKEKIVEENSAFDIETYANNLLDKYFNDKDISSLKDILNNQSSYNLLYVESGNSSEEQSICDSLEFESNECQSFYGEKIIKNLESESREIRKKSLIVLEVCAEDLMNQISWNKVKEILQKMLTKTGDRDIVNLILKVLHKPLKCSKKLQIVSKGFSTIVELIIHEIELFNVEYSNTSEEMSVKEAEWQCEKKAARFVCSKFRAQKSQKSFKSETLIKLMWLLIDCQQQMPAKWVCFNEAKFREIIFSFIHLLNMTYTSETTKLSALELLSVLSPKASWCRYWCHTAVGRALLCSALRKYKNFFVQIIEIILNHMKIKKINNLPPVGDGVGFKKNSPKCAADVSIESITFPKNFKVNNRKERTNGLEKTILNDRSKRIISTADGNTESNFSNSVRVKTSKKSSSEWIVESIPRQIVTEAVFFHSISFVSCLIQFRNGRALFPVQTATRKRLLSVKDLSLSIIDYLENIDFELGSSGIAYTSTYETKILEMLEILNKVKSHSNSSRMSTEIRQLPYL